MSTKAQHTAGEWQISQYTNYRGFSIHAPGRGCIAERWYDKDQDEPYGEEIIANARLIAAAPELLAALESVLKCFVTVEAYPEYMSNKKNNLFIDMATAETVARSAIARATGQ